MWETDSFHRDLHHLKPLSQVSKLGISTSTLTTAGRSFFSWRAMATRADISGVAGLAENREPRDGLE